MPKYHDTLPFNPFIHGTSSQTLSMMQSTNFQLMPIIAMLQDFKVAPMVGELTRGGFSVIGNDSNSNTITGAPAFGRMQHDSYDLNKVIKSYTEYSDNMSLATHQEKFKNIVKCSHKSAFSNLNLLMIYLVRLRQLGVKVADVMPLEEINTLRARLNATVQFYYFILCIEKYIFLDDKEIEQLKKENNLDGPDPMSDYIRHFFSFDYVLEKLRKTEFDIEAIYNDPSSENINKLLEFIKIPKDSKEVVQLSP